MRIFCTLFAALAMLLGVPVAHAEKGADLKPALSGKAVLEEKFDGSELGQGWTAAKGTWQVQEGSLVGREKAEDMHAAVLALGKSQANGAVRFSFQLDGATAFNLSFNHAKGHLFRVVITPDSLTINKDKDKKDPNSKVVVLAKADGKFTPGQWQTLLVEMQGDKVSVQADNGIKLEAADAALATAKTGPRFVMKGDKLLLDDLTIWQNP